MPVIAYDIFYFRAPLDEWVDILKIRDTLKLVILQELLRCCTFCSLPVFLYSRRTEQVS